MTEGSDLTELFYFKDKLLLNYLLHFFTAALDGLIRVDTRRDGGELLLFLTLAHLGVHTVDEALNYCHLVEVKHTYYTTCAFTAGHVETLAYLIQREHGFPFSPCY